MNNKPVSKIVINVIVGVLVAGVLATTAVWASSHQGTLATRVKELREERSDLIQKNRTLADENTKLETERMQLAGLLEARSALVDAKGQADRAAAAAERTWVDISNHIAIIEKAYSDGMKDENPSAVTTHAELIKTETKKIVEAVDGYNSEIQEVKEEQQQEQATTDVAVEEAASNPALRTARRALNDVGGAWVTLDTADVVCGWEKAVACSKSNGNVTVKTAMLERSYDWWYKTMMHEYAHQIQYKHWDTLVAADAYEAMFKSDVEWLADCMAASVIEGYTSGYNYSCTPEQLQYASKAWSGRF